MWVAATEADNISRQLGATAAPVAVVNDDKFNKFRWCDSNTDNGL